MDNSENNVYPGEVDLTNCDREPIHLLGNVQPFGCFIALRSDWLVAFCSENVAHYLGQHHNEVIGEPLKTWFDKETLHDVRSALQSALITGRNERLFQQHIQATDLPVDISIHHNGTFIIVEMEALSDTRQKDEHFVRSLLTQFYRASDSQDLITMVAQQIQLITGFDRVMVYRFLPDGSGEVVAESKDVDLEPFFGLRYPASDIPKQARALYLKNMLRVIANVDDEVVPIQPAFRSLDKQVDLTFSTLRAVSPIHIEYLRNMGVKASMSISIVVNGKLWGLFACHHYNPKVPSYFQRTELELFAEVFALELSARLMAERDVERNRGREVHNKIMATMSSTGSLIDIISAQFPVLNDLIKNDGMCVIVDGKSNAQGLSLNDDMLRKLCRHLNALAPSEVSAIDSLADFFPGYETDVFRIAGVLAIPISKSPRDYLLFFRKAQTKTVNWAGNPEKPVSLGPNGARLLPRSSFELWQQTHNDSCDDWQEQTLQDAESLRVTLLEVMIRHAQERDSLMLQASRKHEVLISELNHRVRNILNLVNAIVVQTEQDGRTLNEFVEVLTGRLVALASAHDQLTASQWSEISFRKMVETEVQAYLSMARSIVLEGDDVHIAPYAATPLVLVMHEMFTNAAKYGALSSSGRTGEVNLRWAVTEKGALEINWEELGGPPVTPPERDSFGMTMIKSVIPHELDGEVDIKFAPSGVRARFIVPKRYLVNKPARASEPEPVMSAEADLQSVTMPREALVVEDNLVIALDMQKRLKRLGVESVSIAGSLATARSAMDKRAPGLILFDVHLGKETTLGLIKDALKEGTPLAIVSGYGEELEIPSEFVDVPILTKPVADAELVAVCAALLKTNQ